MNAVAVLGPHASYILAAYGVTILVLGGLIAWIGIDARQQVRLLSELEAKGIRRRSAGNPAGASKGKT